jgi:hypothetical protein
MKWMQAGTCKFPSYTIISIMSPSYTWKNGFMWNINNLFNWV